MSFELQNVLEPNLIRDIFSYDMIPKINLTDEMPPLNLPEDFWITDTTFRDGQQARPPYTVEQIVTIFKFFHRITGNTGLIRASEFFLYSDHDRKAVEKCMELGYKYPEVTSWIRAVKKDFELVKNMGVKETGILTSCSDYHIFLKLKKNRRQALDGYKEVVEAALEHGITPRCHLEDVTRADIYGFVIPMINELTELTKSTDIKIKIRLCDTMGYGLPFAGTTLPRSVPMLVTEILKNCNVSSGQLEWHGHNDFHLVSANAVSAWLYGCAAANGTFFGFGERTGNPPLEALVISWMELTGKEEGIDTTAITEAAQYFEKEIGCVIPPNYPFVGRDFNTTRAGIHADGLTKNEEIYNIFNTDKFLKRPCQVAITNNSGLAGLAYWIHTNIPGEKAESIRKDHEGLREIQNWISKQYKNGRITSISDKEMLELTKKYLPELFE